MSLEEAEIISLRNRAKIIPLLEKEISYNQRTALNADSVKTGFSTGDNPKLLAEKFVTLKPGYNTLGWTGIGQEKAFEAESVLNQRAEGAINNYNAALQSVIDAYREATK